MGYNIIKAREIKKAKAEGGFKMTRVEELTQKIEEVKNAEDMSKEEFSKFFDKNYSYEGCSEGYYLEMKDEDVDFTIFFTMSDVYNKFKENASEEFESLIENYGNELIREYEKTLELAETELMNNNSYRLNLSEDEREINEIIGNYYAKNEQDIDEEALYELRDYIVEETIDQLEQLIEDEE